MRLPDHAGLRASMERARWCREQTHALPFHYAQPSGRRRTLYAWPGTFTDARAEARAILATLKPLRAREKRKYLSK